MESFMSPQYQELISADEKVVTSRVASCVFDEFIRSRGTLHPYFKLRCYNMQKQKNQTFQSQVRSVSISTTYHQQNSNIPQSE